MWNFLIFNFLTSFHKCAFFKLFINIKRSKSSWVEKHLQLRDRVGPDCILTMKQAEKSVSDWRRKSEFRMLCNVTIFCTISETLNIIFNEFETIL